MVRRKSDAKLERRLSDRAQAFQAALLKEASGSPRPPAMAPRNALTVQIGNAPFVLIRDDCSAEFRGVTEQGVQIRVWKTFPRGLPQWRAKLIAKGLVYGSVNHDRAQGAVDECVRKVFGALKVEAAEAWARLELIAGMVNDG